MQLNISFLPVLLLSATLGVTALADSGKTELPGELGLWVWRRPQVTDEVERKALIDFCRKWEIRRLLVQIRYDGGPGAWTVADQAQWRLLLREAKAAGIAVEALDGDAHMGLAEQREATLARLDAIIEFQKSLPEGERLAGVHYDIEPYLTPRWRAGEKTAVAMENLETYAALRDRIKQADAGLLLAFDIPAFYDKHPETLTLDFNGERKNFHEHIQDLADYIGVMAYRRHATGPNSVLDISSAEMAYGEKIGKKVYPALETGELKDEPRITFYGSTAQAFLGVLREVQTQGGKSPAFGGVLLHHYEGVRAVLGRDEAAPAAPVEP